MTTLVRDENPKGTAMHHWVKCVGLLVQGRCYHSSQECFHK